MKARLRASVGDPGFASVASFPPIVAAPGVRRLCDPRPPPPTSAGIAGRPSWAKLIGAFAVRAGLCQSHAGTVLRQAG